MPHADSEHFRANGRVAIVTGAAQGIGRETAERLGARGYALVLSDLVECAETRAALAGIGAEAIAVIGDISEEATATALRDTAQQRFGRVDVLVNNAGISHICPAEKTSAADWRRVLDVNLLGPFLLCREIGTIMLAERQGSIVNVASIAGLLGVADRSAYNASKHGLIGLTRTLAAEWGGRGVRVNAVCPRLGENTDGCCPASQRPVQRHGYRASRADGSIRHSGRHCLGDRVSRRPGAERLH